MTNDKLPGLLSDCLTIAFGQLSATDLLELFNGWISHESVHRDIIPG